MPLDAVFIACYRHDVHYARACAASVRFFDRNIPLWLLKDRRYGEFSTRDIELGMGAKVYPLQLRSYGWGFAKLEPLFDPAAGRFLYLDADTLLAGPVLDWLAASPEDFVVSREPASPEFINTNYYDLAALQRLDPDFHYPGYTFNTGQWVGRGGLLTRADFADLVDWTEPPHVRPENIFRLGEQGLLNYVLVRGAEAGRWTLRAEPFLCVPNTPEGAALELSQISRGPDSPYRLIVHWCGLRTPEFRNAPRGDLLQFFEKFFYAVIGGDWLRLRHRAQRAVVSLRGLLRQWFKPPIPAGAAKS